MDDIIVYCEGEGAYFVVLNAGCKDKDWDWLQANAHANDDVTLADISDQTALIAVQGPEAVSLVQVLTGAEDIARFHFAQGRFAASR